MKNIAVFMLVAGLSYTEAIKLEQSQELKEQVRAGLEDNKPWGFLKNIVNMDKFF